MMGTYMSACGVLCSGCAAFDAAAKGSAYQHEVAEAWRRIYGFETAAAGLTCKGCLAPDEEVFRTCARCAARRCCREKGYTSCAECPESACALLEKAQSNWDMVPQIGLTLSPEDYERHARPYCGHRERLRAARGNVRPAE